MNACIGLLDESAIRPGKLGTHRLSWHETQDLTDHTARRRDRAFLESLQAGEILRVASRRL